MKLGVYVGSFNPPHKGHLKVANYLLNNKIVDKVIMMATPGYWDKKNINSVKIREEMLKLLQTDNIIVDTIHNKKEYTYEVLRDLKKYYKRDELYLIIGSDNLEKFHLWKNIDELLNYHIIVLKRGKTDIEKYISKFNTNNFIIINKFPFVNISSTEIRNHLDSKYLDKRVFKYIKENHLYERSS